MQIVLNPLQTDSGDRPGSRCLSQTQKIRGDLPSWAETPAPRCGLCAGPGGGPRWGRDWSGLLCGWRRHLGPHTQHPGCRRSHAASSWPWASPASPLLRALTGFPGLLSRHQGASLMAGGVSVHSFRPLPPRSGGWACRRGTFRKTAVTRRRAQLLCKPCKTSKESGPAPEVGACVSEPRQ